MNKSFGFTFNNHHLILTFTNSVLASQIERPISFPPFANLSDLNLNLNITAFLLHQSSPVPLMVEASSQPQAQTCADFQNSASLICTGCKEAPIPNDGLQFAFFCSKACQVAAPPGWNSECRSRTRLASLQSWDRLLLDRNLDTS